ncbi:30S ribosomal protein S12 methylthiotransferase RimO [Treponema rectale]|uniref:Ribosomal protein uS12 methylthiotransferase RimO n=1 Tax=Treponema rectale TaxID=744512 RepID=A0A7M1XHU8_9SPIR|nr:30S ribosomal protein S12 methylthiotransferase RimO [Treponema rectale]
MNIGIVSLGCAKNQVDLEEILAYLKRNGFETVSDPELADMIIINTCGFIDAAKKESIDAILDMIQYEKPVIVTGCLATRYLEDLKKEIPEVALWIPIEEYKNFGKLFQPLVKDRILTGEINPTKRLFISPEREAYLRISDGCNNFCTFCAIPHIRGRFKSVEFETLKKELDMMDESNIRALTVISQDTSMYGKDLENMNLTTLTKEIIKHKNFDFVKLMYLYPDEVEEDLIDLFASDSNLTPYFDLPVQHFADHVLKRMGRRGSEQDIIDLIARFRKKVPEAILRTTIMVGFPGETEEDFQECLKQIREVKFDHLGCFMFCPEEGTPAALFKEQVPEEVKLARYNAIMKEQKKVSYQLNKKRIGKTYKCLVTKYNEEDFTYDCICNLYAPDDIDGKMRLYSKMEIKPGDLVEAKVVNALVYDLDAEVTKIIRKA